MRRETEPAREPPPDAREATIKERELKRKQQLIESKDKVIEKLQPHQTYHTCCTYYRCAADDDSWIT